MRESSAVRSATRCSSCERYCGEGAFIVQALGDVDDQGDVGGPAVEFQLVRHGLDEDDAAIAAAALPGPMGCTTAAGYGESAAARCTFFLDDEVEGFHGEEFFARVAVDQDADVIGGEDLAGVGVKDEHGEGVAFEEALVLVGDAFDFFLEGGLSMLGGADEVADQEVEQDGGGEDEEDALGRLVTAGRGDHCFEEAIAGDDPDEGEEEVIAWLMRRAGFFARERFGGRVGGVGGDWPEGEFIGPTSSSYHFERFAGRTFEFAPYTIRSRAGITTIRRYADRHALSFELSGVGRTGGGGGVARGRGRGHGADDHGGHEH